MDSLFTGDEYIKTTHYDKVTKEGINYLPLSRLQCQQIYDMFVVVVEHDIGTKCHEMAYMSYMLLKRDYDDTRPDNRGGIPIQTTSHIVFTIHNETERINWYETHEIERVYPKLDVCILHVEDVFKRYHILREEGKVNIELD